jgi:hypothetical protein
MVEVKLASGLVCGAPTLSGLGLRRNPPSAYPGPDILGLECVAPTGLLALAESTIVRMSDTSNEGL